MMKYIHHFLYYYEETIAFTMNHMDKPKDKTLFLFTSSYPYTSAAEDTFIEPELPHLHQRFKDVIIIPRTLQGTCAQVPSYIHVDTSLGEQLKLGTGIFSNLNICFSAFLSKIFYHELVRKPKVVFHFNSLIFLVYFSGVSHIIRKWLQKYLEKQKPDIKRSLFYTYWLNEVPLGISQLQARLPDMKIVSRAHGGDLFEDRYNPPYLPYRPEIFQNITKIYTDSQKGAEYLSRKYPDFQQRFKVSLLGVTNPGGETHTSNDGIFRIVSCSFMRPEKRINLLIMGLKELGMMRKDQKFEWVHIGEGLLRRSLENLADKELPLNIEHKFLGYLPKGGVIRYYLDNPVDAFVNTSQSEGTPVSLMEAQSCGIPCIATSVGGNSQIVTDDNGILLSANPSPGEIAQSICKLLDNPTGTQQKKIRTRIHWDTHHNSDKNYSHFSQDLVDILNNKTG
jgi:colanic acid/amylovoran biosynthesis glycosyltransferase